MKSQTQNTDNEIKIYDASECDTIERCPHDSENPYVILNVNVLRDQSISPECRWLVAYLLTNKDGWKIKKCQVISHLKGQKGRDSVNKIFDEAIEAGYMKKEPIYIRNPRGGVLKGIKYYLSETPKFKKCYRYTENQCTGQPTAGVPTVGQPDPKYYQDKGVSSKSLSSKNPPLSSPPERSVPSKPPKGKSLRSEEEEVPVYKILEQTTLPPKDKKRLSKEFSEAEVERAIKISETQQVKKTLMSLLLNILQNPDKWPDAQETQLQTHQQHIAHQYNESLKVSKKLAVEPLMKPGAKTHEKVPCSEVAKANDKTIVEHHMKIVLNGVITQVSLKSIDFEQDIKNATAQLR